MKKRTWILLAGLIALVGGYFTYTYVNKPVVDMSEAVCKAQLSAVELFDVYVNQEAYADSCYAGQVIEVSGKIRSLSTEGPNKSLILETDDLIFGIDCGIDSTQTGKLKNLAEGQDITVRGECAGLNSDVVMVRCIVL